MCSSRKLGLAMNMLVFDVFIVPVLPIVATDLRDIGLKEGMASKRGVEYEMANGVRIPNLGEQKFAGTSDEGVQRTLTAQV